MLYIRTKLCENICNGYKVKERTSTISMQNTTKEHNSVNNAGGGMDLLYCMPFDDVS